MAQHRTAATYAYLLGLLAMMYQESHVNENVNETAEGTTDDATTTSDDLLVRVLVAVGKIQAGDAMSEDELAAILDDNVRAMLGRLQVLCKDEQGGEDGGDDAPPMGGHLNAIMSSKLGKLAMEITSELSENDIDLSDPSALLDFSKASDSSSPLGSLVQKIGSKFQQKFSSGELNQTDLASDLIGMLKTFDKDGLMQNLTRAMAANARDAQHDDTPAPDFGNIADMMKAFGGGNGPANNIAGLASQFEKMMKGQSTGSSGSTRDRLRQKLAAKSSKGPLGP